MSTSKYLTLSSVALLIGMAISSTFYVYPQQRAILLQMNRVIDANLQPGLHFKLPIIDSVSTLDARVLTVDLIGERLNSEEQQTVSVDAFIKWQISDAGVFHANFGSSEFQASQRLADLGKQELRTAIARYPLDQLLAASGGEVRDALMTILKEPCTKLGINLLDVRIRRLELPAETTASIRQRMRAEQDRKAHELRGQGTEMAEKLRAETETQQKLVVANAGREAENIRGTGDAQAAEIYSKSYGKNPEFYGFYRSLQAYQNAFRTGQDALVLQTNSEFFKYFNSEK